PVDPEGETLAYTAPAQPEDVLPPRLPSALLTEEATGILDAPQGPGELGRLGHHRVLKILGIGGMGVVFHAEDTQLGRPVAVKAMLPLIATRTTFRQRFLREARATAAIDHENIVTIHQVGEHRGIPYLVMQLLQGESLEARLRRLGRLPLPEALRIA